MLNALFKQIAAALQVSRPITQSNELERAIAAHDDARVVALALAHDNALETMIAARLATFAVKFAPANNFTLGFSKPSAYEKDRGHVSLHGYLAPNMTNFYMVRGPTVDEVFDTAEAELSARLTEIRSALVRKLALCVIETTHDDGSCTLAQLRLKANLAYSELEALRPAIEAAANALAQSGQPFKIDDAPAGNGAPVDDEAESDEDA